MARWHALHATYEERYVPSVRNFAFVAVFIAIPILTHHYFLKKERVSLTLRSRHRNLYDIIFFSKSNIKKKIF
jgi:hypothetical protein